MITALIFIVVIGVLVLVHELGHFVFAKKAGMKVEEFGFGFPPKIFGIKKGETIYSINLIPFGGFVKIYGEDGEDRSSPKSFGSKTFKERLLVIIAGVTMNFLLATALLMVVNFLGLRVGLLDNEINSSIKDPKIQIIQIAPESPAQKADLRILDEINGFRLTEGFKNANSVKDVQEIVGNHSGETVRIVIKRGDEFLERDIELRKHPPQGQGSMGISLALTGTVAYPWYESIWRGAYDAIILTYNTILGYYTLFSTLILERSLIADVSGPVGIANLTGQAAKIGFNYLLQFIAMISINLAVLNIIPFPALDGGRALLLIIEKVRKKALSKKVEGLINSLGFSLLVALMIYVTIKDISRFI